MSGGPVTTSAYGWPSCRPDAPPPPRPASLRVNAALSLTGLDGQPVGADGPGRLARGRGRRVRHKPPSQLAVADLWDRWPRVGEHGAEHQGEHAAPPAGPRAGPRASAGTGFWIQVSAREHQ